MTFEVEQLAREAVRALIPYRSARSLEIEGDVFLDANESPWPAIPDVEGFAGLNRYPEPQPIALRKAFSSLYGVREEELFIGRGADEAIDVMVRTFCEPKRDRVMFPSPTYGVYEIAARLQEAPLVVVATTMENEFRVTLDAILARWNPDVKVIFLCSPNNPTGNVISHDIVDAIAERVRGKSMVVLDEAYQEFNQEPSYLSRANRLSNVVVLRTLSKAWALAGVRCGVAIGHPKVIALLQKVRAPYPISTPAARMIVGALSPVGQELCRERIEAIRGARNTLIKNLENISVVERIFPSQANFVLVKVRDVRRVIEVTRNEGVIVRDRSDDPELKDCIRISVGAYEETERLLSALGKTHD